MFNTGHHLNSCRAIATELVRDDYSWHVLQPLQKLAKELLSSLLIATALRQNIKHIPILINCSPKIMSLSVYSDEYLIEMPLISSSRTPSAQMICESLAELLAPLSDSFIGENNASLCHKQFDISVAEREAKV